MTAVTITPASLMSDVVAAYPGAQRALFKRYHIGGCASCAFSPDETLEQLCRRNENLDVAEVLSTIQAAHEQDEKMQITPRELSTQLKNNSSVKLLDIRTREEHEGVHLPGSVRMSQDTMQEILTKWPRDSLVVIYDHTGKQSLDAAAYFAGQGFKNVHCLKGGIDAWAEEVDVEMPRYRLEPVG
jgi:rhodanese-related sulfurtransferase